MTTNKKKASNFFTTANVKNKCVPLSLSLSLGNVADASGVLGTATVSLPIRVDGKGRARGRARAERVGRVGFRGRIFGDAFPARVSLYLPFRGLLPELPPWNFEGESKRKKTEESGVPRLGGGRRVIRREFEESLSLSACCPSPPPYALFPLAIQRNLDLPLLPSHHGFFLLSLGRRFKAYRGHERRSNVLAPFTQSPTIRGTDRGPQQTDSSVPFLDSQCQLSRRPQSATSSPFAPSTLPNLPPPPILLFRLTPPPNPPSWSSSPPLSSRSSRSAWLSARRRRAAGLASGGTRPPTLDGGDPLCLVSQDRFHQYKWELIRWSCRGELLLLPPRRQDPEDCSGPSCWSYAGAPLLPQAHRVVRLPQLHGESGADLDLPVCRQQLEPEMARSTPLCMASYKYLFNATRLPTAPSDTARKYDPDTHNHVVVVRKNKFYEVPVVGADGEWLSESELEV